MNNTNPDKLSSFYEQFLDNSLENVFYEQLKKILDTDGCSLSRNQQKIEKLINAYHIKKQEKIININPFWDNKIRQILVNEYEIFSLNYKFILSQLSSKFPKKKILFYSHEDLWDNVFTINEVFYIYILTYIKTISNTEEKIMIKDITFLHELRSNFLKYFNNKLLKEQVTLYLMYYAKSNEIDPLEFKLKCDAFTKQQNKVDNNWELSLLFLVKYKFNNNFKDIAQKENYYELEKKSFFEFYRKEQKEELFIKFFHKFSVLIHEFFLNNKLVRKIKGKIGKNTYSYLQFFNLELFSKIDIIIQVNSKLPMICMPKNWDKIGKSGGYYYNDMSLDNNLVKKLKEGFSKFIYSQYTIDSINLLQTKSYVINKNYFKYIKTVNFKSKKKIKTIEQLCDLYMEYVKLKEGFDFKYKNNNNLKFNYTIYQDELLSIKSSKEYKLNSKENKTLVLNNFYQKYGMVKDQLDAFHRYLDKYRTFLISLNEYKEYQFLVKICELYGSSIYSVPSRLDFRGRIFPLGRVLHRASGVYKHLNQDTPFQFTYDAITFDYLKIYITTLLYKDKRNLNFDLNSYIDLFKEEIENKELNFTKSDYNLMIKYITDYFLLSFDTKLKIKKKLHNFWNFIQKLILEASVENQGLSILALLDYFNVKVNPLYLSELAIEIDQSCSGPQIYSLLSMDKEMGNLTNLLSSKKEDLYLNFLQKFKIELNLTWKTTSDENKLLLLKNFDEYFTRKNFSKLIIMPTFYNMGDKGVRSLLKNLNNNHMTEDIQKEFVKIIRKVLNNNYTKTINYQKILVEIVKILYKNKSNIHLKTLDGSFVIYKYILIKEDYGKIWSFHSEKYLSYRIYLPMNELDKNKVSMKQVTTFPPNFIHSIDGAICRIIIQLFHKLYNYVLEPLHDSFRLPLLFYKHLQYVIKYVYLYIFLNKYFHKYKIGLHKKNYYNLKKVDKNNLNSVVLFENNDNDQKSRFIYELNFNCSTYLDYRSYFDFLLTDSKNPLNVLNYCFLDHLTISNDDLREIQVLIKKLEVSTEQVFDKENEDEEKDIILQIINSDFMFFF